MGLKSVVNQLADQATAQMRNISYRSLSGADIQAMIRTDPVIHPREADKNKATFESFATLQTISVSMARSVFPVRRLGQSQPAAYTRGGVTVGGTLIFTQFSKDALADIARRSISQENYDSQEPFHVFQMPEFDVVILGATEFGALSNAIIGGVTLTNFGTTMSIHDVITEASYSFVARYYAPLGEDVIRMDRVRSLLANPFPETASSLSAKGMSQVPRLAYNFNRLRNESP